jgi:hypothetical protein
MSKIKSANLKQLSGFNIETGEVEEASRLGIWDHL